MSDFEPSDHIPYSAIIGQQRMKQALEISYVQPGISGVLLTGERGTAKSTLAWAFAGAFCTKPMVTLPINATEDRVVGGWNIDKLVHENVAEEMEGLIEEADGSILYIDEVNLLDDHIVNIILDVAASGILSVEHQGRRRKSHLKFTMVGTMNPEEGELRTQLLDRFDLYIEVGTETENRESILLHMIDLDATLQAQARGEQPALLKKLSEDDRERADRLEQARVRCSEVTFAEGCLAACVKLAQRLNAVGHRGERVLALSVQAQAAIDGHTLATIEQLRELAPLAFQHRCRLDDAEYGAWDETHESILGQVLDEAMG